MNQNDMDVIAKDIVEVTAALTKIAVLKTASVQGCAMAFALAAATYVTRSGGSEDDYMNLVRIAWTEAQRQ